MTWKASKIKYMNICFGGNVARYEKEMAEDKRRNDRAVYIIIYNNIMEMLDTLPDEPHLYVKVAINDKMREDTDTLESINLNFTGYQYC